MIGRPLLFLIVCGSLVAVSASPPVVGVARSRGAFRINDASVPGTATLLDGASIETASTSSDVSLTNGGRLMLASASVARVHQDRLILDRGTAELNGSAAYRIETRDLRIQAADSAARIRVAVDGSERVQVAALLGNAEVRNSQGMLVARVLPGAALQLKQTGASGTQLTGKLTERGGKYFLTDETTKVTVELRGSNLKSMVGKQVQVVGSPAAGETAAAGASQVINVTQITEAGSKKRGAAAAGAGGGAAAGAGTTSGLSTTTIAVLGGVAATAGIVGGLYAAGTIGGGETTVSR